MKKAYLISLVAMLLVAGVAIGATTSTASWAVTAWGSKQFRLWEDSHDFTGNDTYTMPTGPVKTITVQVFGTFTATVDVYGSMDGTEFTNLTSGSSLSAAGWVVVEDEDWLYYRVTVSSHSSGTVETVIVAH